MNFVVTPKPSRRLARLSVCALLDSVECNRGPFIERVAGVVQMKKSNRMIQLPVIEVLYSLRGARRGCVYALRIQISVAEVNASTASL